MGKLTNEEFFIPFSVGYLGEWVNSQRKNFLFPFQWGIKVNGYTHKGRIFYSLFSGVLR